MQLVTGSPWPDLFRQCQRAAFHLEVRDAYAVPSESEPLRRFLNGDPPGEYDKRDWTDLVRETSERGVAISRVRVVTVPHSGYQRWLLSVTGSNVDAGEDIRYVPRNSVDPADIPHDDWWLFDGQRVAFNLVDQNGKPAGAATTADPGVASFCQSVKDRLWRKAIPFGEYVTSTAANISK